MSEVNVSEDGIVVDAEIVARAFGLAPAVVREDMRSGRITTRCEVGVDEDEGRWRLTFFRNGRALRMIVDGQGDILIRGTFPVSPVRRSTETD
jgi:hypothetical protein